MTEASKPDTPTRVGLSEGLGVEPDLRTTPYGAWLGYRATLGQEWPQGVIDMLRAAFLAGVTWSSARHAKQARQTMLAAHQDFNREWERSQ